MGVLSLSGDETSLSEDGETWTKRDFLLTVRVLFCRLLRSALWDTPHTFTMIYTTFFRGLVQKTYLNAFLEPDNTRLLLGLPVYAASCVAGRQPYPSAATLLHALSACVRQELVPLAFGGGPTYSLPA